MMNFSDYNFKPSWKACKKEYGTSDIREMYPYRHVVEDIPWESDEKEKEALEALRTLYYDVATCYERTLKGLADYDVKWPETSYIVEYIRKRVKTAEENIEYLCKENDELRSHVQNLKDLINQIHEDSDI